MVDAAKLLDYYNVWVNGESLSRWQLRKNAPPPPLLESHNGSACTPRDGISFELPKSRPESLAMSINGSNLEPIHQILLHGSQATGDTCGFSDVDIVIVLDDSRLFLATQHQRAIRELKRLLRSMFLYDCLMHHGFMFMLRSDFTAYRESFLPIETLRKSLVLWGPQEITLLAGNPADTKLRLQASARSLARRFELRDHERDDFGLKMVLSGLLLMPSLLLASVGIFCYKRESFSLAPQQFPEIPWAAIREAETLRLAWQRPSAFGLQRAAAKVFHPHVIIRLSYLNRSRTNVCALVEARSETFTARCQEFLHCITRL